MKAIKKLAALLLTLALALSMAACATKTPAEVNPPASSQVIDADREGNPITLPDTIERIISIGPSNTEILSALGFAGMIVAADNLSAGIEGLDPEIPMYDMMAPDVEQIIALEPDIIIASSISKAGGEGPFKVVSEAGICVVYIPSSESIDGIKEDIRFIGQVVGAEVAADEVIAGMENDIEAIKAAAPVEDAKTVYFEISAAPYMYSFGNGVFLDEMLEIIGAENLFAEQEGWMSVADEQVLDLNPDVILTSVNYIEDPIGEIMSRPGWGTLTAVQNNDVYYIDADASNRPSQNIIKALKEIAEAVYPDIFDY
ncbi:MAG: ABC transporter substrate-binding protein [Clostridiales bacterium]|jgi:iron complex transport system substrate-binding protein|nr:ABC transporter substrate-binding protein [Clostridiales bacterium]